ncbi:Paraquat-inducible protein B [Lacunisphaera limnophila]|uniref:Paraquat-inducible protein B n=1 Tax=Lacunisphaera limnophila TaxID=1838286 RepID=A0A1D8ARZ8_9BACT|nr:MlaD family protein [Lacunisphaera limnophila]AOS43639.1 Paraquat-inducible protein B [Lacunisphaera limnophila]
MSDSPAPSSRFAGFLVWLVPLTALVVSGWLLVRQHRDRGPVIEIAFANGAGLEAGKTPLVHKGVVVGTVMEVGLNPRLDGVTVRVQLDGTARPLAVEGSEFWLLRPEIGLSGVHGLETLLSGARLSVRAGVGRPAMRFQGLDRAPAGEGLQPGHKIVLRTDKLNSLQPGSPVLFREVKVGVVEDHRLADDATHVLVTLRIFRPYDRLVRSDTHFWNSGGLSMKLGLLGAQVHTNSLESLITGGVAFATPDNTTSDPVPEGTVFPLYDDAEKAWLKWAPKLPLGPDPR